VSGPLRRFLDGGSIDGFRVGAVGVRCPRVARGVANGRTGAVVMQQREQPQSSAGESFLNCPRCGLTIKVRASWLAIRFCPRCLARSQSVVELFSSALPAEVLYAEGSAPRDDRRGNDRRVGWR
jgi:hypothetical protein